jgi:predicted  nucleic acid-binding Zn-ribbon protein
MMECNPNFKIEKKMFKLVLLFFILSAYAEDPLEMLKKEIREIKYYLHEMKDVIEKQSQTIVNLETLVSNQQLIIERQTSEIKLQSERITAQEVFSMYLAYEIHDVHSEINTIKTNLTEFELQADNFTAQIKNISSNIDETQIQIHNQTQEIKHLQSNVETIRMTYVEKENLLLFFQNLPNLDKYHVSKTIPFLLTYSTWIEENPNH